ncbi:MAG: DNA polymerase I [Ruminococcaceae bacterium]|nr:DNA polymerase I [Oscillospiraceae bacterium]
MKLMILDGNSLVNRAFYGIRMLNAPDGTPTNALYGFLAIVQRLLDEEKPDGLCVAFDVHAPTFRHERYTEYKAGRRPMPEELRVQIPLLKELLDAMGVQRLELPGWEADDLLGTVSLRCRENWDCVIVSGDKDALQLVDEHVRVLNVKSRMGQTETIDYTVERFREEYGFDPARMIDLKALMGDSSDNLPGVPGIGEKTALELLKNFGSLAGVYENMEDERIKAGVRKKLLAGRESAELSFELATIARNAPIDYTPTVWTLPTEGPLYALMQRFGFRKFIEKWKLQPGEGGAVAAETRQRSLTEICDFAALEEALAGEVALYGGLSELALVRGDKSWYMSRESFCGDYDEALRRLLAPTVRKSGHHIKDLLRAAREQGLEAGGFVFDSALAAYLLDATAGGYDIERLCLKYCGWEPQSVPEEEQLSLLSVGSDAKRQEALAERAAAVEELGKILPGKLAELQMTELYEKIELPLCAVLAEMEHRGFLVDREALSAFGEKLSVGIEELQQQIWREAGREFNINSPKQLGAVLFEELGLPGGKKTKTGWSTNADVLEKLRFDHAIVAHVLEYRELAKLKSTYADGLLKVIGPDGRIHTSFQMTVTDTGRLSSREPNLQNIPVRRELGAMIRDMFVSGEGMVLVDADYSQIELRLLAHISGDEHMRAAFLSGEDVHAVTASQVFGVPLSEVTSEERRRAKAVNFGIVYGISAFSLSEDLGVFVHEARAYMDAYLERFAGVREYQKNVVQEAKERGYVETLFHRRRALPELSAPQFPIRAFGERVAMNMPIQGTAADVMKLAMVNVAARLRREGLEGRLILQVHDELIVECPEAERDRCAAVLREEMEQAVNYAVPLVAEAKWGRSWAEAH